MNDVEELKVFAAVHARAQRIPARIRRRVVSQVDHDGDGPGSWVGEWSAAARAAAAGGAPLLAARLFTMARFPYVDGPARQSALEGAGREFDQWRAASGADLQELTLELPEGAVRCWASGLAERGGPLVVLMGGIVSTKEQWAPTLLRMRRFGVIGVAAEMPRAGVNPVPYDAKSWRMVSALLDALDATVDTARTYAMMMSFSGHLALRCALDDPRISGIVTVGAPVRGVFADSDWQRRLPRVTLDTLAHLIGTTPDEVGPHLRDRALAPGQLEDLDIPLSYVASRRDEIIPAGDIQLLKRHVRQLDLVEHDDVHASPRHVGLTGPWLLRSLLRMHGSRSPRTAALGAAVSALRAGHRLADLARRPAADADTNGGS